MGAAARVALPAVEAALRERASCLRGATAKARRSQSAKTLTSKPRGQILCLTSVKPSPSLSAHVELALGAEGHEGLDPAEYLGKGRAPLGSLVPARTNQRGRGGRAIVGQRRAQPLLTYSDASDDMINDAKGSVERPWV